MSNRRKIKKLERRPVSACRCPDCRAVNRATRRGRRLPDRIVVDPGTPRKTGAWGQ